MELIITSFKAGCGDSFLIEETASGQCFLVDCGFKLTYSHQIKKKIDSVDFIILTHSDKDHINGAFPLLEDYPEKFSLNKVYINSPESIPFSSISGPISIRQAKSLVDLLKSKNVPFEGLIQGNNIKVSEQLTLEIISPTHTELDSFNEKYNHLFTEEQEASAETPISLNSRIISVNDLCKRPDSYPNKDRNDASVIANSSSIAFILKFKNKKILFLGDSHPEVISDYLSKENYTTGNKAKFDYVKLSHHGSVKSISTKLLSLIECNNFIVSTNGGMAKSKHPDVETIAKLSTLVDRGEADDINFYFNYPIVDIESRNGPLLTREERQHYKINYFEQNEIRLK